MNAPSMQTAALAFALSSWVEGLTQLRTALLMPYLPRYGREDDHDINPSRPHGPWKDRILAWLMRRGREMDDMERMSLGVVDVTVSASLPILCKALREGRRADGLHDPTEPQPTFSPISPLSVIDDLAASSFNFRLQTDQVAKPGPLHLPPFTPA